MALSTAITNTTSTVSSATSPNGQQPTIFSDFGVTQSTFNKGTRVKTQFDLAPVVKLNLPQVDESVVNLVPDASYIASITSAQSRLRDQSAQIASSSRGDQAVPSMLNAFNVGLLNAADPGAALASRAEIVPLFLANYGKNERGVDTQSKSAVRISLAEYTKLLKVQLELYRTTSGILNEEYAYFEGLVNIFVESAKNPKYATQTINLTVEDAKLYQTHKAFGPPNLQWNILSLPGHIQDALTNFVSLLNYFEMGTASHWMNRDINFAGSASAAVQQSMTIQNLPGTSSFTVADQFLGLFYNKQATDLESKYNSIPVASRTKSNYPQSLSISSFDFAIYANEMLKLYKKTAGSDDAIYKQLQNLVYQKVIAPILYATASIPRVSTDPMYQAFLNDVVATLDSIKSQVEDTGSLMDLAFFSPVAHDEVSLYDKAKNLINTPSASRLPRSTPAMFNGRNLGNIKLSGVDAATFSMIMQDKYAALDEYSNPVSGATPSDYMQFLINANAHGTKKNQYANSFIVNQAGVVFQTRFATQMV